MIEVPDDYMCTCVLVDWAQANLNIIKPREALTNAEIKKVMRWIGECSYDTIYIDGDNPRIGRHGIGLMLTVTLMEFPQ